MIKSKLAKDTIISFTGINIAYIISYVLFIFLIKLDKNLFNDYTFITSIFMLAIVPCNVLQRIFTIEGEGILGYFKKRYKSLRSLAAIILAGILVLVVFNLLVGVKYGFFSSIIFFLIVLVAIVTGILRGINQNLGNFTNTTLSVLIEASIRTGLGLILGYTLGLGINGILVSIVIGYFLAGIVSYFNIRKKVNKQVGHFQIKALKSKITSGIIFGLVLELFANFDILFSNYYFSKENNVLTELNTLQFFRKTIFFAIFAINGVVLYLASSSKYSKKFSLSFSFIVSFILSMLMAFTFYLFKGSILEFLGSSTEDIPNTFLFLFLLGSTLVTTNFIIATWTFANANSRFTLLVSMFSLVQIAFFITLTLDIESFINIFLLTNLALFIVVSFVSFSISEVIKLKTIKLFFTK